MKIVIPGGAGHVGQAASRYFQQQGHTVVVLSRSPKLPHEVYWDGNTLGEWSQQVDGADVVLNLAGKSIQCRYTPENFKQLIESRVNATRIVGQAIQNSTKPPKVWLNASTATIYSHRFDAPNDEFTGIIDGTYPTALKRWEGSIKIAKAWEEALFTAETPETRRIALRTSLVMSPIRGSVFMVLLKLAKRGLLGTDGPGTQFVSWIHEQDFLRSLDFLIANEALSGPVNLSAPGALPNREFNRTLRRAAHAWIGPPVPEFALKIGMALMGTEPELLLKSRRVAPAVLTRAGFVFEFPEWRRACEDLVAKASRSTS